MVKLKLGPVADDKPMKLAIELPAAPFLDLVAYGQILGRESGRTPVVAPMPERLVITDRGYAKARRDRRTGSSQGYQAIFWSAISGLPACHFKEPPCDRVRVGLRAYRAEPDRLLEFRQGDGPDALASLLGRRRQQQCHAEAVGHHVEKAFPADGLYPHATITPSA
ncbi:hypothetical protein ATH84_103940 [Paracoccus versutus]|uniref:Uncharacterized protein n=1 Tax=Paracoccus versutus TaxID=34007 RepID=A0A3E0BK48_PARVE|nr:hypothetical protein BDD41_1565 [Paracoccus versutus]REG34111.1 hypothetical protein ATH84_103940 [Paracoccus versutus]